MMANMTPEPLPATVQHQLDMLETSGRHLRGEDSMALASFVMLLFDHMLTFGDEVEYIWKKRITPISVLYLLNRYFAPPAFAVCMVAIFSASWTTCLHFAKFEGITTLFTVLVAEIMLILRVYAVFNKSLTVLSSMLFIWVAQLSTMSWTLANSGPVVIPRSSVTYGCVLVASPKIGSLDILFVAPSLLFDTTTVVLLLVGLYRRAARQSMSSMVKLILRDGFFYFFIVFIMNLSWTVTGLILASDLKNVLSFFCTAMTNILIGRLTLNLKMHLVPVVTGNTPNPDSVPPSWIHQLRTFVASDAAESNIKAKDLDPIPMLDITRSSVNYYTPSGKGSSAV